MRRRKWLERAKSLLIAVLALTVLALTVLALPAKTVTDTPWLAALVRPFASVMGLTQGELTATPMADAASVTGAAQPVAVSVRNPAGRTSFQFDTAALDTAFEQFGAALGQRWRARRSRSVRPRFVFRPRSARPRSPSAIRAKFPRRLPRRGCRWRRRWTRVSARSG